MNAAPENEVLNLSFSLTCLSLSASQSAFVCLVFWESQTVFHFFLWGVTNHLRSLFLQYQQKQKPHRKTLSFTRTFSTAFAVSI